MSLTESDLAEYRQVCKVCGRPDKFNFSVSDAEWEAIVPDNYRRLVVCLSCFDTFAHTKGLNYALAALCFVGDQGVFSFQPD
jgi:hypothetical protein